MSWGTERQKNNQSQMKTFNFLRIVFIASMLCVSLNSCGGDDDEKQEDASKAFVGLWQSIDQRNDYYIFLEDGICQYIRIHLLEIPYRPTWTKGYWTYNTEISRLATSIEYAGQWEVSLSNNNSWAGTNINSGVYTAYKKAPNAEYLNLYIDDLYIKWKTENEQEATLSEHLEKIKERLLAKTMQGITYEEVRPDYSLREDENENDFVFQYQFSVNYKIAEDNYGRKTMAEGKVTVVNPYSPTKCQLVFTGGISKTFTIHSFIN